MAKLTKSQRKAVSQKASKQQNDNTPVTLQQQNVYHMGASEIDALHRMQEVHPDIVQQIMGFRNDELKIQNNIIEIERKEQEIRIEEVPHIRKYAFRGQLMAYSLGIFSLIGASYFGYHDKTILAGVFLTSTIGIAFAQFFNKSSKQIKS